jgi:hypothetical protein
MVDPPEPVYQENPELAMDEIKQIDYEVAGADVSVTRVVTKDGETYIQDTFNTHYLPWASIYEYGPGTKVPENDDDDNED